MALLQPECSWRPASAAKCTLVTAALRAASPSSACTGLDIRSRGVGLGCSRRLREWSEEKSTARGIDIAARGGRGRGVDSRGATFCRARGSRKPRRPSPLKTVTASRNSRKDDNKDEAEEDGFGEDALEELFAQLEKDLEAGGLSDVDDVSEEDVMELENELAAALAEIEEQEGLPAGLLDGKAESISAEGNDPDGDLRSPSSPESNSQVPPDMDEFDDVVLNESEEDEDEERTISLEPWQLRKLAAAAELGRRKVNIKALSAEVGLDRFDVLAWLRDPPPELLLYSATMDTEEDLEELQPDQPTISSSLNTAMSGEQEDDDMEPEGRRNWHSQKRLRKEHEATFERVFRKTDRPTNAMVQSMVELTHVPRKRVVEWFEQRRKEVNPSQKIDGLR